jgi:predicted membrane GTPase involved in stress response
VTLEQAIACIRDDELVEVTPRVIRIRKRYLDPPGHNQGMKRFGKTDF